MFNRMSNERLVEILKAAKEYIDRGFRIAPFYSFFIDGKKVLMFGKKGNSFASWKTGPWDLATFKQKVSHLILECKRPIHGISLITGSESNVTVIDWDNDRAKSIIEKYMKVEEICRVQTKRGVHLYFLHHQLSRTLAENGLDSRGPGGLAILPPSIVGGHAYTWIDESPLTAMSDRFAAFLYGVGRILPPRPKYNGRNEKNSISDAELFLAQIKRAWPNLEYDKWIRLSSALWNEFGEEATPLLHRYYPEEQHSEYNYKYDKRLRDVTYGTFMHYYKAALQDNKIADQITPNDLAVIAPREESLLSAEKANPSSLPALPLDKPEPIPGKKYTVEEWCKLKHRTQGFSAMMKEMEENCILGGSYGLDR